MGKRDLQLLENLPFKIFNNGYKNIGRLGCQTKELMDVSSDHFTSR